VSNAEIIRELYAAFEAGNGTRVLELCDPECVVTQDPALPWGGRYEGLDGVATFALALGGAFDSSVEVIALFEAGDRVIQYGRTRGTVVTTGAAFDIPEVHIWTLRHGKIVAADFFIESSAMLVALGARA
jgi:uncharacterized protein